MTMSDTEVRRREREKERCRRAREMARLWKVVRASIRLIDTAELVARGTYRIEPATMTALRHHCDEMRGALAMAERELAEGGDDE